MVNKVIIEGRLTKDPRMGEKNDIVYTRMRIANSVADYNPVFVDVVAFNRLAETCSEHLKKGRRILIEGRIDNGKGRIKIVAHRIRFLDYPQSTEHKTAIEPF